MKKILRIISRLIKLSLIPLATWLINELIFYRANIRRKSKIKEHFYEWRHGDIRYVTAGQGPPLLLIHNPGGSLDEWEAMLQPLSMHYKVYALDLIGFGYSDKPNLNYSAYLYVTLLNDFIRDIIGRKTNVAASGLAGAIAVTAYSFEPDRFNKMLLVSPTGLGSCTHIAQKEDLWRKWLFESPLVGTSLFNILFSRLGLRWFLRNQCFYDPANVTRDMIGMYHSAAHYGGSDARIAIAALLTNFLNVNIENKLAKMTIPVHIIWGENNLLNPADNFQSIAGKNPAVSLTVFEKAGAMAHLESPKAFCRECRRFFDNTSFYNV